MLFTVCKVCIDLSAFSYPYSTEMPVWQLWGFVTNGKQIIIFTSKLQVLSLGKEAHTLLEPWMLSSITHLLLQLECQQLTDTNSYRWCYRSLVDSFTLSPTKRGAISTALFHMLLLKFRWHQTQLKLPFQQVRLSRCHENFQRWLTQSPFSKNIVWMK